MAQYLSWETIDRQLDLVEEGDQAGIVAVFLEFEGLPLDVHDGRGARSNVNVSTFAHHLGLYRHTFNSWLNKYGNREAG